MARLILFLMLLHFSIQELAIVYYRYPLLSELNPCAECCDPVSQYHSNRVTSLLTKGSQNKFKYWFDGKISTTLSQKEWLYIIQSTWKMWLLKGYTRPRPTQESYDCETVDAMTSPQNMPEPLNDAETRVSSLSPSSSPPLTMQDMRSKACFHSRGRHSPDSEELKDACKSVWDSLIKPECLKQLKAEIYTLPCKVSLGLSCIIYLRFMQLFKHAAQLIQRVLKHNSVPVVLLQKWLYGDSEVFNVKSRQNILSALSTVSCHRKQSWWAKGKVPLKVFKDESNNLAVKVYKEKKNSIVESLLSHYTFWRRKVPVEASVFIVSSLEDKFHRLATFRPLSFVGNVSFPKSFIILSEFGFYYPGSGVNVVCVGCGHAVDLMKFSSDPWETWCHHPQGCRFVREPPVVGTSLCQQGTISSSSSTQVDNALRNNSSETELMAAGGSAPEDSDKEQEFHAGACGGVKHQEFQKCGEPLQSTSESSEVGQSVSDSGVLGQSVSDSSESEHSVSDASMTGQPIPDPAAMGPSTASPVTVREPKDDPTNSEKVSEPVGVCSGHDKKVEDKEEHLSEWEDSSVYTPEQDMTRWNGEAKKTWNTACTKNPGHHTMFPLPMLNLIHLPDAVSTLQVMDLIHHLGKLTVRIVVGCSSKHRPDLARQSVKGKRAGTGYILSTQRHPGKMKATAAHSNPGRWQTIRNRFLYNKNHVGKIYIQTNRHVVYNNEEATQTTVDFFFNSSDRKGVVSVKGKSVRHSSVRGDYTSILECHTLDSDLLDRINMVMAETPAVVDRLSVTSKVALTKTALVISHPHGREKMLSYGNSVVLKYSLNRELEGDKEVTKMAKVVKNQQVNPGTVLRKVLLYAADTCPGSSGAPVFLLQREQPGQDSVMKVTTWVHNGMTNEHKLSGSVMQELTPSEVTAVMTGTDTQGVPKGPAVSKECQARPKAAPWYMWHSAYPVYVTYQNRIDSFRDLPENSTCTSEKLARAGFFYAALADCVRCFHCGLGLLSWRKGNNYYAEHNHYRPDCQFLQVQIQVLGKQILTEQDGAGEPSHQTDMERLPSSNEDSGFYSSSSSESDIAFIDETQDGVFKGPADVRPEDAEEGASPVKVSAVAPPSPTHPTVGVQGKTASDILTRILQIENKALHQRLMCKVCFQRPIRTVFLPCGDFLACAECAKILNFCPLCYKHVDNHVLIFSS